MKSMSLTELAVLFDLHSVRMSLLILGCVVISLLALCAGECDLCSHKMLPSDVYLKKKVIKAVQAVGGWFTLNHFDS